MLFLFQYEDKSDMKFKFATFNKEELRLKLLQYF